MFKSNEKVSVVIPCYNAEDYIEETIVSVLEQSYRNVEVVVVNDGSTDSSEQVIKKYSRHIKHYRTPNLGGCHARNFGLSKSSGGRINFLDSDDLMYRDCISEKISRTTFENEIPVCRVEPLGSGRLNKFWTDSDYSMSYALAYGSPSTPAPLHYREDLEKVGGFNERLPCAQEYDLHLRIMAKLGKRFVGGDAVGIGIRVRNSSVSRSSGLKMQNTLCDVLEEIRAQFFNAGEYDYEIGHHLLKISQHAYRAGYKSRSFEFYCKAMGLLNGRVDYRYFFGLERFLIRALGFRHFEALRFSIAQMRRARLR